MSALSHPQFSALAAPSAPDWKNSYPAEQMRALGVAHTRAMYYGQTEIASSLGAIMLRHEGKKPSRYPADRNLSRQEEGHLLRVIRGELADPYIVSRQVAIPLLSLLPFVHPHRDDEGNSLIVRAAMNPHVPYNVFEYLVRRTADINEPNNQWETPVLLQAYHGRARNVALMHLRLGADITKTDGRGLSPLMHARAGAERDPNNPRYQDTVRVLEAINRGANSTEILQLAGLNLDRPSKAAAVAAPSQDHAPPPAATLPRP